MSDSGRPRRGWYGDDGGATKEELKQQLADTQKALRVSTELLRTLDHGMLSPYSQKIDRQIAANRRLLGGTTMTEKLYWHFLAKNRNLGYGDNRKVVVGETLKVDRKPILCECGLHASERAIDALSYASGPIICRVTLGGIVIVGDDKAVAAERTAIAMADATELLHEFACWCAERALEAAKVTDRRCYAAITAKRRWLKKEITDADLDAAWTAATAAATAAAYVATLDAVRDAAWAAAWAAVRDAVRAGARTTAWVAARTTAWGAAWGAASDTAREAARSTKWDEQNQELESRLCKLLAANEAVLGGG